MSVVVWLDESEIAMARWAAGERYKAARLRSLPFRNGDGIPDDTQDFKGVLGELAAAKYFNLYWSPTIGDRSKRDVGGFLEVKSVDSDGKRLWLQKVNDEAAPYVLARVHNCPKILLAGWAWGCEIKDRGIWEDRRQTLNSGAWFLSNASLNSIDSIFGLMGESFKASEWARAKPGLRA